MAIQKCIYRYFLAILKSKHDHCHDLRHRDGQFCFYFGFCVFSLYFGLGAKNQPSLFHFHHLYCVDGVHFILSCYVNTTDGHNIFICLVEIQMSLCKNNNNNHTAHAPKQRPTEMFTGVNKILFSGPPNCFLVPESKLFGFLHFCRLSGLLSSVGQVIKQLDVQNWGVKKWILVAPDIEP